jgi:sirohydrochlorin ferrochelatase
MVSSIVVYLKDNLKYHFGMKKKTLFLLLFHGSARKEALTSARAFLEKMRTLISDAEVEICFLRGQKPDLLMALEEGAASGHGKIRLIQLFLLPGAHINEDIPGILKDFGQKHPQVDTKVLPCLVELHEFSQMLTEIIKSHD